MKVDVEFVWGVGFSIDEYVFVGNGLVIVGNVIGEDFVIG